MSGYIIASSLCVDTDSASATVNYPLLGRHKKNKRAVYWKCVYVFYWMSLHSNPDRQHVLYTNDKQPIVIDGVDIKERLEHMGIAIHFVEFSRFDPGSKSQQFRNAFYKYEAIKCLSQLDTPSILLDVDCLWHQPNAELDTLLASGQQLLIQDTYRFGQSPDNMMRHGISQSDLLTMYQRLDPQYPQDKPVWFGGELIAGSPQVLLKVVARLERVFDQVNVLPELPTFANGTGVYDNDEFLSSFVFNSYQGPIINTMDKYSSRVDTVQPRLFDWPTLANVPIWHLPPEKVRGFPLIFSKLMSLSNTDDFQQLANNIGGYVGMPNRTVGQHIDWMDHAKKKLKVLLGRPV